MDTLATFIAILKANGIKYRMRRTRHGETVTIPDPTPNTKAPCTQYIWCTPEGKFLHTTTWDDPKGPYISCKDAQEMWGWVRRSLGIK